MSSSLVALAHSCALAHAITWASVWLRKRDEKSASSRSPIAPSMGACACVATTAPSCPAAVSATRSDWRALLLVPCAEVVPSGSHST